MPVVFRPKNKMLPVPTKMRPREIEGPLQTVPMLTDFSSSPVFASSTTSFFDTVVVKQANLRRAQSRNPRDHHWIQTEI